MKLQKAKSTGRAVDTQARRLDAKPMAVIIGVVSMSFVLIWLSVGGASCVVVAAITSFLHGPICLVVARILLCRVKLKHDSLLLSSGSTVCVAGAMNYRSIVLSGVISKWVGLDAISLLLAVVLTGISLLSWYAATKLLFP